MKVLYFGIYSKGIEYPRNRNIIYGLRLNGVEVIEVYFKLASSFKERIRVLQRPLQTLHFFLNLIISFLVLAWKFIHVPKVDVIVVGHPGYFHIHLAWLLRFLFQRQAILVYDIFIPLYEMLIEDRELLKRNGLFAQLIYKFEKSCCRYADLCLIDTKEHCNYMVKKYGLSPKRVSRIFVGSTINNQAFDSPQTVSHKIFRILFVGTYIPLHGIDIILKAARYLTGVPDIHFCLVGSGQLREDMENLARKWKLSNTTFQDWIPTEHLCEFIRSFDLSLGIFGTTPKTGRVIPSKIYDICAAGVPFITADTPAIREVFRHKENAYLVPPGNPEALVDAIQCLKADRELRDKIAEGAKEIGETIFSPKEIGKIFVGVICR
ncbi:MAG: glycosyltransferase [Nitrospiraceae bacterium]|nr:glycosyltransferase [Nitrospiraceae bacterium]